MGLVGRQRTEVFLVAVPTKLGDLLGRKRQQGERFDALKIGLGQKKVGGVGRQKVEQHQSAATAIGRLIGMFFEGAVEQTGRFPAGAGGDPSAARFGVAGKKQGSRVRFQPRKCWGNASGPHRGCASGQNPLLRVDR